MEFEELKGKIVKFVKKELKRTAILSYLRFEDNKIVIDELSPIPLM